MNEESPEIMHEELYSLVRKALDGANSRTAFRVVAEALLDAKITHGAVGLASRLIRKRLMSPPPH